MVTQHPAQDQIVADHAAGNETALLVSKLVNQLRHRGHHAYESSVTISTRKHCYTDRTIA